MFLRFAHLLGVAMWIGGALAAMIISIGAKNEPAAIRAGVYRLLARVYSMLIGTGALLVVASGLLMTMAMAQQGQGGAMGQPRIVVMQAAGMLGAILVIFVGVPTSIKISGLSVPDEKGEIPPVVERLRRRQAMVSSVAGVLALVALVAVTLGG